MVLSYLCVCVSQNLQRTLERTRERTPERTLQGTLEGTLEGRLNRTTERALRDICILYPPKWMNSKRRKTVKGGVGGRGDFGHELADKFATFLRIQASQKRILREQ